MWCVSSSFGVGFEYLSEEFGALAVTSVFLGAPLAAFGVGVWSSMAMMSVDCSYHTSSSSYDGPAMMQDVRSLASFVLGAMLCRIVMHSDQHYLQRTSDSDSIGADTHEKGQLYAFML
mmetsp:Transcript_70103/g.111267  ORF Transcript_70103/g.111267 Transcript_70103/m.111267 type:complete len:118 (+) Transcript_70103:120-473(+)